MLQSSSLMGSLEEETLVQMVHDFIESESATPVCSSSSDQSLNPRVLQSENYTLLVCLMYFVQVVTFGTCFLILMGLLQSFFFFLGLF